MFLEEPSSGIRVDLVEACAAMVRQLEICRENGDDLCVSDQVEGERKVRRLEDDQRCDAATMQTRRRLYNGAHLELSRLTVRIVIHPFLVFAEWRRRSGLVEFGQVVRVRRETEYAEEGH